MDTATAIEIDNDTFGVCPVCDTLIKRETLEHHVEAHFEQKERSDLDEHNSDKSMDTKRKHQRSELSKSEVLANDAMLARVLQEKEKWEMEKQKEKEDKEFRRLQVLIITIAPEKCSNKWSSKI